jgi:stage II sporulation protein D
MRRSVALSALVVLLAVSLNAGVSYAAASVPPETMAPVVLVGLFRADEVVLTCPGSFQVESSGNAIAFPAYSKVTFRASGNRVVRISGPGAGGAEAVSEGAVQVKSASGSTGAFLTVEGHSAVDCPTAGNYFAGSILLMADGGRLAVANLVDVESYVRSVVSCEMPDGWPAEALKAQAVAVRSYLAYKTQMTNTPGFGLPDYSAYWSLTPGHIRIWANDQAYKGVSAQKANAVQSTDLTRGQILTYNGLPAAAYFHSAAEGMTEDVRNVWGGSVPYLVAVTEEPYESPYHSWTYALSGDELSSCLSPLGVNGTCVSLEGCDPGQSGRWSGVIVSGASGEIRLKGTEFRNALGQPLRSLLFSSYTLGGGERSRACLNPSMPVCVAGGAGRIVEETPKDLFVEGGGGMIERGTSGLHVLSGSVEDGPVTIIMEGKGWGHGVGLSQWGARASALSGEDYPSILSRYYPGCALELWW